MIKISHPGGGAAAFWSQPARLAHGVDFGADLLGAGVVEFDEDFGGLVPDLAGGAGLADGLMGELLASS